MRSFARSLFAVRLASASSIVGLLALAAACGGGMGAKPGGNLMDQTFAGQNACNPKNHDRPFIINWDATDQSSFQSAAKRDVIYVHYEGCELKVLDGCRDDSVAGTLGSYSPVVWTSGGVESIDIHDKGELYAKLPLGALSLSGKVESGEKLHMEYYVSGTQTATREKVYRSDLTKMKGCEGATHFVYNYNLGAFALASQSSLHAEVNGSYFGFGGGGSKDNLTKAEKKGGDISTCTGQSAKEVESCKVPVRLTLRAIEDGANPDIAASKTPDTDESLNAAGKLKAESDTEKKAAEHLATANIKKESKDGKSCLAELDEHDKLDPRPTGLSTNPASGKTAGLRAECVMLSGQCDAGKVAFRKALEATKAGSIGAEQMDKIVDAEAGMFCQGSSMSEKDQFAKAKTELTNGGLGVQKKSLGECQAAFDTFMKLYKKQGGDDPGKALTGIQMPAPNCFAKAGDCAAAFKTYKAIDDARDAKDSLKSKNEKFLRSNFENLVDSCKGK